MKPGLVFVYNARTGLFNTVADIAHKIFSPQTYACNLCHITYTAFGMRQEWQEFLSGLDVPLEFLHADELEKGYGIEGVALPAIFKKMEDGLVVWIDADTINRCRTLEDLKETIRARWSEL